MVTIDSAPSATAVKRRRGPFLSLLLAAAREPLGGVGIGLVGLVVAVAVLGPAIAPYSASAPVGAPYDLPSADHWFGTDELGRDVLSRVLNGGWALLLMALSATVVGIGLGALAGVTAAYLRGKWDVVIMRAVDVLLSFPQLVFSLLLLSLLGPRPWLIVLAVGLSNAPQTARILYAATLDVSERDFVRSAELLTLGRLRIMAREILPNLTSPLMVEAGLRFTFSIIIVSGLAFLGFGQAPPAPDWGVMINENRIGLQANPWSVIVPIVLIAIFTVGANFYTDAIGRVALTGTPKTRKTLRARKTTHTQAPGKDGRR